MRLNLRLVRSFVYYYLRCELLLLQLFEYPESDIFVLVVPDSDSILSPFVVACI